MKWVYRLFYLVLKCVGYAWFFYFMHYFIHVKRYLYCFFNLFLFYILHKNKSADTIQTSNKYSIKLLNIHH